MSTILSIGAGPLQVPVIRKIKELGHRAIAVDANPSSPGFRIADECAVIDIVNTAECLAYASVKAIDGVVTVATDLGVMTTARIAAELGLPGLDPLVADFVRDKHAVRRKLRDGRICSVLDYWMLKSESDVQCLKDAIRYPVIVKPTDGSGSRGVRRVDQPEDLRAAFLSAIQCSLTASVLAETFVTGNEFGVESFVADKRVHVLGVMRKTMTPAPNYAELGHACPAVIKPHLLQRIKESVQATITCLGINYGSVNMDLLVTTDESVVIIDIGARMGGNLIGSHIIPLSCGIDLLGNTVNAALGNPVDFAQHEERFIATRLLDFGPGTIVSIGDYRPLLDNKKVLDILVNTEVGREVSEYRTNQDSCGYVVVTEDSERAAMALALETRNQLRKFFSLGSRRQAI